MKYAVIRLGGQQFKVEEGQTFEISKTDELTPEVLLLNNDGKIEIGTPVLENVPVKIKVVEEKLGEKVEIRRFKAKSRYRRKVGHRQPVMVVEVEKIGVEKGIKDVKGIKEKAVAKKTTTKVGSELEKPKARRSTRKPKG